MERLRERLALRLAPWLYLPRGGTGDVERREALEDSLAMLAERAYGRRDAVWTSYRTLAATAMQTSFLTGIRRGREWERAGR